MTSAAVSDLVDRAVAGRIREDDPVLDEPGFRDLVAAVHAAMPAARRRGDELGLPPEVVDATLEDVDRKVAAYGDANTRGWLVMLLRLDVVQLGRLQFERALGEHGRAIHIPELGPLTPESVDDALGRARALFGPAQLSCETWMLDPAVADLPPTSNVRRFRERFVPVRQDVDETLDEHGATSGDRAVCKFVFGASYPDVLALPDAPRSSVRALVLDRLRAGHHWTETLGIIPVT